MHKGGIETLRQTTGLAPQKVDSAELNCEQLNLLIERYARLREIALASAPLLRSSLLFWCTSNVNPYFDGMKRRGAVVMGNIHFPART
jgi:hypothetical protein